MEEAIKNNNVMLYGLKKIDSKLLNSYEKTYKAPIEKRGRKKKEIEEDEDEDPKPKKQIKKVVKKEFNIEEIYGVEDLEFLNSEYDIISKKLESGKLSDDDYEIYEDKQDKLYDLIQNLEDLQKFKEKNNLGGSVKKKQDIVDDESESENEPEVIEDIFKCNLCNVSFNTKQKMTRHIKTKKHEKNIIDIDDKEAFNKKLLIKARKAKVVKQKNIKLKPYYYIGIIPDGYREATEIEALKNNKFTEYGKKRIDPLSYKDFIAAGTIFNDKLSESDVKIAIAGMKGKLNYYTRNYDILSVKKESKLSKDKILELTNQKKDLKDKFIITLNLLNRYLRLLNKDHKDVKQEIEIKKEIPKINFNKIDSPSPYSDKKPISEPTLNKVLTTKEPSKPIKTVKNEKMKLFKCNGKPDLEIDNKHFINNKLNSKSAEKLFKMNIRLTEDYYNESDKNKYFYSLVGKGILDKLYNYIPNFNFIEKYKNNRTEYTRKTTDTLSKIGSNIIKSIVIQRAPVMNSITSLLNVMTLGDFKNKLNQTPYDDVYHLSIVVNGNILIEKLELINIEIINKMGGSVIGKPEDVKPEFKTITKGYSPGLTINNLLDNCRKRMGDYKFFSYSGSSNNCQDFIINLLQGSGLGDKEDYDFIKQDVESIFKGKESLKYFMDTITDIKGIYTDMTGGELENRKPKKHMIKYKQ
jgi:hypothetical protein